MQGYKTPYISKILMDEQIRPVMQYTRPHTKDGFFRKSDYVPESVNFYESSRNLIPETGS